MVVVGETTYYGILDSVVELVYAEAMRVVLFKCIWYNTGPGQTKSYHDLLLVNTSITWYDEAPYILATTARLVFYIDDPKASEDWKIVNVMSHRGIYKVRTLATDASAVIIPHEIVEPY